MKKKIVESLCPNGQIDKHAILHEIANDPNIKGVAVIYLCDDEEIRTGWSDGIGTSTISLGILKLQNDILEASYE